MTLGHASLQGRAWPPGPHPDMGAPARTTTCAAAERRIPPCASPGMQRGRSVGPVRPPGERHGIGPHPACCGGRRAAGQVPLPSARSPARSAPSPHLGQPALPTCARPPWRRYLPQTACPASSLGTGRVERPCGPGMDGRLPRCVWPRTPRGWQSPTRGREHQGATSDPPAFPQPW
jgi:hypothetical protein